MISDIWKKGGGAGGDPSNGTENTIYINPNYSGDILGFRYTTFNSAKTWILASGSPSANNRYTLLFDGRTTEAYTMSDWIDIRGISVYASILAGAITGTQFLGVINHSIEGCTLTNLTIGATNYINLYNCQVAGGTGASTSYLLGILSSITGGDFSACVFSQFTGGVVAGGSFPGVLLFYGVDVLNAGAVTFKGGSFLGGSFNYDNGKHTMNAGTYDFIGTSWVGNNAWTLAASVVANINGVTGQGTINTGSGTLNDNGHLGIALV